MSEQSVIGVYNTMAEAEDAVRMLDKGKFPIKQVSFVAQDMQSVKEVHGYVTAGDVTRVGANTGDIARCYIAMYFFLTLHVLGNEGNLFNWEFAFVKLSYGILRLQHGVVHTDNTLF